jgi:hypothetical protein
MYALKPQVVKDNMVTELQELRKNITIGIVGGSDLNKQVEQLGKTGEDPALQRLFILFCIEFAVQGATSPWTEQCFICFCSS